MKNSKANFISKQDSEDCFERNGGRWNSSTVTLKVSGRSNYILAKMKLLSPQKSKSALVKEIVEQALLDLEKEITEL